MRELDLYSGLPLEKPPPAKPPAPGAAVDTRGAGRGSTGDRTAPSASVPRVDDWIENVWRSFLPAIRGCVVPRAMIGEGGMGVVIEVTRTR